MKIIIQSGDPTKLVRSSDTHFFPEKDYLHAKLHVKYVEDLLKNSELNDVINITTNSEHIINRCRVAKKEKEIEDLVIEFNGFEDDYTVIIETDYKGALSVYPDDFMEEFSKQLCKLI